MTKVSRNDIQHPKTIEEEIRESLNGVLVPGINRSLNELNLIREIDVSDSNAIITLSSAALNSEAQKWIESRIKGTVIDMEDFR